MSVSSLVSIFKNVHAENNGIIVTITEKANFLKPHLICYFYCIII
jgi:hypothetical protein